MSDDEDLFDINRPGGTGPQDASQGDPILGPTAPMPVGKRYVPESQQVSIPPPKPEKQTRTKGPFRWVGVPIALLLTVAANDAGFSFWGWVTVAPMMYVALLRGSRRWIEALAWLTLIFGMRVARVHGGPTIAMRTMPGDGRVRVINQLVEEGDLAGLAASWLPRLGAFPPDEDTDRFYAGMHDLYVELRDEEGYLPSTVPATYLGMQTPSAFDLIRFSHAPEAVADDGILTHRNASTHAVLFLHGGAGSSMALCWIVAKAARTLAMRTYCPSVGPDAAWLSPDGRRIVDVTLERMRGDGSAHVHLVGLSSGGVAASLWAAENPDQLASVTVISGAASNAEAAGIPTAVIHGARDAMMPPSLGRDYASRAGVEMLEVSSGHFALIDHREDVSHHLVTFWRGLGASEL